ncbi:hypothetical protein FBEOM_10432 [Fusarium beomiforme]|uniref:Meiotically up-regulated gene 151 protein n=1 Tax=Fusarium beomiforme TaxID=44412 RepID=A0A9P5AD49_9HYPO|nr:hypothetical protein FBEOM_10432 [Fusarium beomiforme]
MAGLVGYASSDEEEEIYEAESPAPQDKVTASPDASCVQTKSSNLSHCQQQGVNTPDNSKSKGQEVEKNANSSASETKSLDPVPVGPVQSNVMPLGPSLPPTEEAVMDDQDPVSRPASPYSRNRALLRDLTLPLAPNLDIPPSPPGSPPAGANKKFKSFLELKKKGTHFNYKLEQSSALKNPSLMDKLMTFVEVDERNQYSTTLATDLWNPAAFPDWAFRDKLRKSHDKLMKDKEAEKTTETRMTVEFVPSSTSVGQDTIARSGLSRGEKRKSVWN